MSKRGDNIHKRKDGRWEGRYKKERDVYGKVKYGSVYGKTYREVKDKLNAISMLPANSVITKPCKKTFGDVLNLWMENNKIRLKGGTIYKYQNMIDTHIMPELGEIKLNELDSTVINAFLSRKSVSGKLDGTGGLSSSYVRSIMLVINAALQYAVKEQLCAPLKTPICKPMIQKQEISILNLDEQKRLENHLKANINTTTIGILISLHTGLRIGEVCALTWDDVDLNKKIIKVRHTVARIKDDNEESDFATRLILDTPKTKSSIRDIPISSVLLPCLLDLYATSPLGFLLTGSNVFMQPRTFEYRYHKVLEECNVGSINYHALRHTFATRCIEAGVDVKSLSEILGHANVSITLNTYVHSSIDMKRNQLEKMIQLSA